MFQNQNFEPFNLKTLNISIQNIKCPKNTKNACLDLIFPGHFLWRLCCVVFARACRTQSVLTGNAFHKSRCLVLCFVICDQSWKWTENCVISSSKHEMCFNVFHPLSLLHFRAHQALFSTSVLERFIFWMGIFKDGTESKFWFRNTCEKYNRTSGTNLS